MGYDERQQSPAVATRYGPMTPAARSRSINMQMRAIRSGPARPILFAWSAHAFNTARWVALKQFSRWSMARR
jgi:hypothetical protein